MFIMSQGGPTPNGLLSDPYSAVVLMRRLLGRLTEHERATPARIVGIRSSPRWGTRRRHAGSGDVSVIW